MCVSEVCVCVCVSGVCVCVCLRVCSSVVPLFDPAVIIAVK